MHTLHMHVCRSWDRYDIYIYKPSMSSISCLSCRSKGGSDGRSSSSLSSSSSRKTFKSNQMGKGTDRFIRSVKLFVDVRRQIFVKRYGQNLIDLFDLPIRVVLSPFTLAYDIAGSAPRGFGIPKLISDLSFSAIFVIHLFIFFPFPLYPSNDQI